MFRALNAHLQEDTVVYMQHMVLSLCKQLSGRVLLKHRQRTYFKNSVYSFYEHYIAIMPSMHLHTCILDRNPENFQYQETLLPTNCYKLIRIL